MKRCNSIAWLACAAAVATITLAPATPSQAQPAEASWARAPYAQYELDQMLAPIALYPDALLAQVLTAAIYPHQVADAGRFLQLNAGVSGDALADAVAHAPWDPSVQALTQFPSVLAMMNERPDWTERLGDAWLAQSEQVMDTVQGLRARAWAAGSLQSNEQQQVIVQDRVIAIEPWRPGLLWVPYYNPLIVFGAWWWPAHRPFAWVPPPAYRPPHFGPAYASGMVWGPTVPLRARLWREPPPVVWRHAPGYPRGPEYRSPHRDRSLPPPPRDRFVPPPPRADPGFRAPSDRQWRGPEFDGRWQQRPAPARVMPEHDRTAPRQPAPPRGDAPQRNEPRQPAADFGRPWAGADRRDDVGPRHVQKPMPMPAAQMPRPQAAPQPQVAPPPQPQRSAPPPQAAPAPQARAQAPMQRQPEQPRGPGARPDRPREKRDPHQRGPQ